MEEKNTEKQKSAVTAAEASENTDTAPVAQAEASGSPYKNGFLRKLDNFYGVTKNNSSIRIEIVSGIATFLAMCYILKVIPNHSPEFSLTLKFLKTVTPSVFL